MPHRYRSWYRQAQDGQREGLIPESEIPLYLLEVVFGKGTADLPRGSIVYAIDPDLEESESPVYFIEGSSWSVDDDGEMTRICSLVKPPPLVL